MCTNYGYGQTSKIGVDQLCQFLGRLYPEAHFMVTPHRGKDDYVIRLNQNRYITSKDVTILLNAKRIILNEEQETMNNMLLYLKREQEQEDEKTRVRRKR